MKKALPFLLAPMMLAATAQAAVERDDLEFLKKAAIAGEFEVQSSRLAQKTGSTPEIKAFADSMVRDHGAAGDELKALAKSKGVALPKGLDKAHAEKLAKLKAEKPGKDFNEEYADLMEDSHDDAVKLFQDAADKARDPDIKAFAQKTLPTLKMHSEHAEKLDMADLSP